MTASPGMPRTIGSLFSGIGGLELGLERAGLGRVVWQAELDDYCREVLARHWPDARRYEDVREVDGEATRVDVVCGGFPCQPVSVAGKRLAQRDERWLWPEFARVVETLRPAIVVVENVPGLRTAGLRDVLADLAALGFDAEWTHLRACDLGAPHERDRLALVATDPLRVVVREQPGWFCRACGARTAKHRDEAGAILAATRDASGVALGQSDSDEVGESPVGGDATDAESAAADSDGLRRLESAIRFADLRGWSEHCGWHLGPLAGVDDGLPGRLERRRKALGNAVVVAWAQAIGQAIAENVEVVA